MTQKLTKQNIMSIREDEELRYQLENERALAV